MLADGDSITFGFNISPATATYPNQAMAGLASFPALINAALGGFQTSNIISHLPSSVTPFLTRHASDAVAPVYTLMIGVNDWWNGGVGAAAIYSNIQSICSTVTATGARMVLFSPLPASIVGWEAVRQSLITLESAGGACPYTFSNTGNDPTIGQPGQWSNLTYYQADGVHPTAAGDTIIATYMLSAVQSLGVK